MTCFLKLSSWMHTQPSTIESLKLQQHTILWSLSRYSPILIVGGIFRKSNILHRISLILTPHFCDFMSKIIQFVHSHFIMTPNFKEMGKSNPENKKFTSLLVVRSWSWWCFHSNHLLCYSDLFHVTRDEVKQEDVTNYPPPLHSVLRGLCEGKDVYLWLVKSKL